MLFAFVVLGLLSSVLPRDWLRRTSPKWPVFCRVGRITLTQSVEHNSSFATCSCDVSGNETTEDSAEARQPSDWVVVGGCGGGGNWCCQYDCCHITAGAHCCSRGVHRVAVSWYQLLSVACCNTCVPRFWRRNEIQDASDEEVPLEDSCKLWSLKFTVIGDVIDAWGRWYEMMLRKKRCHG